MPHREIWCCGCVANVQARLTDGREAYPHRPDLYALPFWKCDACGNHVGCHHKTKNPTRPLGCIATASIKRARSRIHRLLDPLWKGAVPGKRTEVYRELAKRLGIREYHTADLRSVEEVRRVCEVLEAMAAEAAQVAEE